MQNKIPPEIYEQILEYSIIPAVDAVIYNNRKVLLAKRTQEPAKGQWWIPGGRQNKNEMPEDAVKRKIREETGLDIKVEKLILVDDVVFDKTAFPNIKTGVHYIARVYLARLKNSSQQVKLDKTQEKYIWADKKWFKENERNLNNYVVKSLKNSGYLIKMEWSPADIIDRMSIVKLKIERIGFPELQKEFDALKQAIEIFKKGVEIKDEWLDELYEINKQEWNLLGQMNDERKKDENYEKIGRLYIQTELVNKRRSETKNKIIVETGVGFKEIKKNHPSE